nr:urea ABC transporter permease subunit UrtB [Pseudomonas sp.]
MLRLLLTFLLLWPLASHASEGELFLSAKPAEQARLLESWAAQPDVARLPLLDNLRQGRIAADDTRKLRLTNR